jgi:hypothetical protein
MEKHIIQFFKFLQDKEGKPAPLKVKLLYPEIFGNPTEEQLTIEGELDLSKTVIKELPQGLEVSEDLWLDGCTSLKKLPKGLTVGWDLWARNCTSLKELSQDIQIGGGIYLNGCTSLIKLPKGLEVEEHLNLNGCTSLKELPPRLQVGKTLNLTGCTSLEKLPEGLEVGWDIWLRDTPIARKYTEEEIRKMVEDGGGYVDDEIILQR